MQKELRLSKTKRFSTIHQKGHGLANRLLVIKTLRNNRNDAKFAFLVGRKVGNAVVRNRTRRRLKEMVRTAPVQPGWDVIIIARKWAAEADHNQLKKATQDLLKMAGLLRDSNHADNGINEPMFTPPAPIIIPRNHTDQRKESPYSA